LCILNTGAQWHMLPQSYPNYKTVHRRFQAWCRDETLRRILTDVANDLRDRGVLDEEECFIDATFVMAKGGGLEIGATKRGKGMKIMAIVDRHGMPLSVSTHAANHHEVRLVQLCFDFYMIEAKPENLIGDRAYDSDPLDEELRKDRIEMIAPHRSNRSKPPTQDRRRLSRYMRRWLVERFFAWIQWQRRILIRWEYHAHNWTALHELGHWTGAAQRLDRDLSGSFGSKKYAQEELVAEITSAFVCASLGIVPTVRHADYIGSWLEVLREDDRSIVRAASAASKAADYLLAFCLESNECVKGVESSNHLLVSDRQETCAWRGAEMPTASAAVLGSRAAVVAVTGHKARNRSVATRRGDTTMRRSDDPAPGDYDDYYIASLL